jgi:hypothetical protein
LVSGTGRSSKFPPDRKYLRWVQGVDTASDKGNNWFIETDLPT